MFYQKINVMKKLILTIAILFFFSISPKIYSQCTPSFTWTQTANNVISLTNTTTGAFNTSGYYWTGFNLNAYNNMDVPSLVDTFYIPGTYQVCLLYFDSFNDCNRSEEHTSELQSPMYL